MKAFGLGWLLPARFETISPTRTRQMQAESGLILIDVRNPQEWEKTGIPKDSHRLTYRQGDREFSASVLNLCKDDKSTPVALSCQTGYRSGEAAAILTKSGFGRVYSVEGGITSWIKEGMPTESVRLT